ncbi:MAG: hypothetical protein ACRDTM_17740 [Micromonosporaceae bacterium]
MHWFGVTYGNFVTLTARAQGEEILQEGTQHDGRPVRWTFSEITDTCFLWQGYISDDAGENWRQEQEMRAVR